MELNGFVSECTYFAILADGIFHMFEGSDHRRSLDKRVNGKFTVNVHSEIVCFVLRAEHSTFKVINKITSGEAVYQNLQNPTIPLYAHPPLSLIV